MAFVVAELSVPAAVSRSENDAVQCGTPLGMALGPPASADVLSIRDHFPMTARMKTIAVGY